MLLIKLCVCVCRTVWCTQWSFLTAPAETYSTWLKREPTSFPSLKTPDIRTNTACWLVSDFHQINFFTQKYSVITHSRSWVWNTLNNRTVQFWVCYRNINDIAVPCVFVFFWNFPLRDGGRHLCRCRSARSDTYRCSQRSQLPQKWRPFRHLHQGKPFVLFWRSRCSEAQSSGEFIINVFISLIIFIIFRQTASTRRRRPRPCSPPR